MRTEQTLQSGLAVRQDFRDAVRFVMFETGVRGYDYATHGGTAFVVNYRGRLFGVTCGHVLGRGADAFSWKQLVITDQKFGQRAAGLKTIYRPAEPSGDAEESDVLDLAVVEFADDVDASFFGDTAYALDAGTAASSRTGHKLVINGAFKRKSAIVDETIVPVFGHLEFDDCGPFLSDRVLRRARARFDNPEVDDLTGFSGSPVFDSTSGKLAGFVTRAGLNGGEATAHFIDVAHLVAILGAIVDGSLKAQYRVAIQP